MPSDREHSRDGDERAAVTGLRIDRVAVPVAGSGGLRLAGRYWLQERIGERTGSTVWRAWDEVFAQTVAIKVLGASAGLDRAERSRLRSEFGQTARLSHPGLVTVHDVAEASGPEGDMIMYVAMELLAGETLATRLEQGPLCWREAVRICAVIASALAILHEAGACHLGVGLDRVFLSETGPKLLGLARTAALQSGYFPSDELARRAQPAPEHSRRSGRRTGLGDEAAADVYALGAVLAALLTGRSAPEGPRPREVPDDVMALCLRCREPDPSHRPSAAKIADVLKAAPARARRSTRGRRFQRLATAVALGAAGARAPHPGRRWEGSSPAAGRALVTYAPGVRRRLARRRRNTIMGLAGTAMLVAFFAAIAADPSSQGPAITFPEPTAPVPAVAWPAPSPDPSPSVVRTPAGDRSPPPDSDRSGPPRRENVVAEPTASRRPDRQPATKPDQPRSPDRSGAPSRETTLSTLSALQQAVYQGVNTREIRYDVGLDLDNVITNLRNDVVSGRVTDPRPRAQEIRNKIYTRLGEHAITQRRADQLIAILGPILG